MGRRIFILILIIGALILVGSLCSCIGKGKTDSFDLLLVAIGNDDLSKVKSLVAEMPSLVNRQDSFGRTALHYASEQNRTGTAGYLISQGASLKTEDNGHRTPLQCAVSASHREMLEYLVLKGANVNEKSSNADTPLHIAAENADGGIVESLIAHGAIVNVKDSEESTPLHRASEAGNLEAVTILLKNGAAIESKNVSNETALDEAIISYTYVNGKKRAELAKIIKLLRQNGAVCDVFSAARLGDLQAVRRILAESPTLLNEQDDISGGDTLLHAAASSGSVELCDYLQKEGASINMRNNMGETPLHRASGCGHIAVAGFLISGGADINAKDDGKKTPLNVAEMNKNRLMTAFLLRNGARE